MPIQEAGGFCEYCQKPVLGRAEGVNHILHFLITVFTCGLWVIPWMIMGSADLDYACPTCGRKVTLPQPAAPALKPSRPMTKFEKRIVVGIVGSLLLGIIGIVGFQEWQYAREDAGTSDKGGSSPSPRQPAVSPSMAPRSTVVTPIPATARGVISRYGAADVDDSTEHDSPPPPMITRWMDYKRANVRLLFFPSGRGGAPRRPPIDEWTVVGCVDLAAQKKISKEEAARRLAAIR